MDTFFRKYCSLYKNWNNETVTSWQRQEKSGILKFIFVEGVLK